MIHRIMEYARHCGHTDLLREYIDGHRQHTVDIVQDCNGSDHSPSMTAPADFGNHCTSGCLGL
nr:DUF664 domain-containing protein [Arthrobacter sp. CAN_C5]